MRNLVATLLAALWLISCSEEFNPVVEGERPFVVFALLSTATSVQFIRVHNTSPPTEMNPGNPLVPGTLVTVTGPGGFFVFRDTVIGPPAGSDEIDSIGAYVSSPFLPLRDQVYRLNVSNDMGEATATLQIPGRGDLSTRDFNIVRNPAGYPPERTIEIRAGLSSVTMGYVVRFVIEYERFDGSSWVLEHIEVPRRYENYIDANTFTAEFPQLTRRSVPVDPDEFLFREFVSELFLNGTYQSTILILRVRHGSSNLRFKRAMFILTQADQHFFTYYSYANFFQDKYTIRIDQPDYSNVSGALGFFGAMTEDTLAYTLPENISVIEPQ